MVLPLVPVFAAAFNFLIGVCLLLAVQWLVEGRIPGTVFLFPIVMVPFIFLLFGISLLLSSLTVFFRDAQHAGWNSLNRNSVHNSDFLSDFCGAWLSCVGVVFESNFLTGSDVSRC